jgi:hypothetical protein
MMGWRILIARLVFCISVFSSCACASELETVSVGVQWSSDGASAALPVAIFRWVATQAKSESGRGPVKSFQVVQMAPMPKNVFLAKSTMDAGTWAAPVDVLIISPGQYHVLTSVPRAWPFLLPIFRLSSSSAGGSYIGRDVEVREFLAEFSKETPCEFQQNEILKNLFDEMKKTKSDHVANYGIDMDLHFAKMKCN